MDGLNNESVSIKIDVLIMEALRGPAGSQELVLGSCGGTTTSGILPVQRDPPVAATPPGG